MRNLILLLLIHCFTGIFGQQSRDELLTYLSNYENGKLVSEESRLIDISGDTISYAELKGTWLLIDYWSVTCRPCIKELPTMNAFALGHGIENLNVVAISVDEDQTRWSKLSPKRQIQFPSFYAARSTSNDIFGLNLSMVKDGEKHQLMTSLPRYSLIDPNGRIVERELSVKPSDPGFKAYVKSLMN